MEKMKLSEIKPNPNNPRLIKDDKFNCLTCETEFQSKKTCKSCNSQKRQNTLEEFAIKKNRFDWLNKFDKIYANAIS